MVDSIDFQVIPGVNLDEILDSIGKAYSDAELTKIAARSVINVTDIVDVHSESL